MLEGPGNGRCPKSTTGFSSSPLLAGMPDNGGQVSNLYAEANPSVGSKEEATVTVIDNTSANTPLLACKITPGNSVCSNPATASIAAAPGDRLEVQMTGTGKHCGNKQWSVRFRY